MKSRYKTKERFCNLKATYQRIYSRGFGLYYYFPSARSISFRPAVRGGNNGVRHRQAAKLASKRDFLICGSIVRRGRRVHNSASHKGRDKVLSQTITDIPTEEVTSTERLADPSPPPISLFFFFLHPDKIYGNVCVQRAPINGRRDDCQEFNENWVNPTYISARCGLLTK